MYRGRVLLSSHCPDRTPVSPLVNESVRLTIEANESERSCYECQALAQLTTKARMAGHRVDQSALAFNENGRLKFYGSKNLVDFLSRSGLPHWTHTMTV